MTDSPTVREAAPTERATVLNVLDGAALETDVDAVGAAIERGDVLVAESPPYRSTDDAARDPDQNDRTGTVVGALVLDGDEVTSVAVRQRRRDQGIGTALVEAAAARRDRLVAEFDRRLRPFYESVGFAVEPVDDGDRYRGRFRSDRA